MTMSTGYEGNHWRNPGFVPGAGAHAVSRSLERGGELRRRVGGGLALGTFLIELPNPATLVTLALSGFDFAVLDMEHSSIDFTRLETLLAAAHGAGLPVLVRTWGEDVGLVGKVLDMGAHGVMAAHVETPERARAVVEQARYAPLGGRGFSPLTRFDALERPLADLNAATYVVVQIEGRRGVKHAVEIAGVEGVDAVFVGPYDLALSLGAAPGSREVQQVAIELAKGMPPGVALGIYIDDPATCGAWARSGFALQCVSFDGRMLADGARAVAAHARQSMDGGGGAGDPRGDDHE